MANQMLNQPIGLVIPPETLSIIIQEWEESESGWGSRPDGISVHISMDECKAYRKRYWDRMPQQTPAEYEREASDAWIASINDKELILDILEDKNIRLFRHNERYKRLEEYLVETHQWHGGWVPVKTKPKE